ncbi:MAG: hypothetical protein AAB019_05080, partial [Planctomycetota bacterium]
MRRKKRVARKPKINAGKPRLHRGLPRDYQGLILSAGSIFLIALAPILSGLVFLVLEMELNSQRQDAEQLTQDVFEVNKYLFNNARETNAGLSALSGRLGQDYSNLNDRLAPIESGLEALDKDFKEATEMMAQGFKKNYFDLLDNADELNHLKKTLTRDSNEMIQKMVRPSVRIKTNDSVGGGTIVYSRP